MSEACAFSLRGSDSSSVRSVRYSTKNLCSQMESTITAVYQEPWYPSSSLLTSTLIPLLNFGFDVLPLHFILIFSSFDFSVMSDELLSNLKKLREQRRMYKEKEDCYEGSRQKANKYEEEITGTYLSGSKPFLSDPFLTRP